MNQNLGDRTACFPIVMVLWQATAMAQPSHTEDFTTTTFKNEVNATADWNTAGRELKLFPFELTLVGS